MPDRPPPRAPARPGAPAAKLTRRGLLARLSSAASLPLLGGCAADGGPDLPPAGTVGKAALLAPLSGARGALGQIMLAAARLGGNPIGPGAEVEVVDAGDTDEAAAVAARAAVEGGAQMLLGPLFAGQARAAAEAAGRGVPVVALSNDESVAGGNLFVFGITPAQSARAILGFAASRGLRRVAVVVPPDAIGARSAEAAAEVATVVGVALAPPVVTESADRIVAALAAGGSLPDAVYLPAVSGPFEALAAALGAADVQLLGSDQWSAVEPTRVPGLEGAWFAGPDPIRFEAFALALEEAGAPEAGVIGGLAFDAVEMARLLGRLGQQDREGLLREGGFDGVLGPYRFLPTGQCQRALAVLNVADGATTLIGSPTA